MFGASMRSACMLEPHAALTRTTVGQGLTVEQCMYSAQQHYASGGGALQLAKNFIDAELHDGLSRPCLLAHQRALPPALLRCLLLLCNALLDSPPLFLSRPLFCCLHIVADTFATASEMTRKLRQVRTRHVT